MFANQTGSVNEGGGSTVTVQFSAPFTGTLKYTVDYGDGNGPQPGEIDVAGSTTARIPINALTDDKSAFALTTTIPTLPHLTFPNRTDLAAATDWSINLEVEDADFPIEKIDDIYVIIHHQNFDRKRPEQ